MTMYVAFVAVFNVLTGFYLGRIFPAPVLQTHEHHELPKRTINDGLLAAEVPIRMLPGTVQASKEGLDTNASILPSNTIVEQGSAGASSQPPAVIDDIHRQLADVRKRAHYCRSTQDKQLTRQTVDQLVSFARMWCSHFNFVISGHSSADSGDSVSSVAAMSDMEMFASQTETTIANLGALDYSIPVDEIADALERELDLLDAQQRKFCPTKN